jgi:hypothetical protein
VIHVHLPVPNVPGWRYFVAGLALDLCAELLQRSFPVG